SVVSAPHPGPHSQKPDCFYEMIEAYFPSLPKIELNARRARPGWDRWGLDAPEPESSLVPVEALSDHSAAPVIGDPFAIPPEFLRVRTVPVTQIPGSKKRCGHR